MPCRYASRSYTPLVADAIKLKTLQQNGRRRVPAPPILLQRFKLYCSFTVLCCIVVVAWV